MGYGSGRFPIERASKLGHLKLIEHEQVGRLIRQFESTDGTGVPPIGQRTGSVALEEGTPIRFVVTIDGGQAVIPNELRRDKRIAFLKICAMLVRTDDIDRLRRNPIIDPRELSRMFEGNVWFQAAVLPLAGIHVPGETVKETIRKTVDAVLEYTRLYDVLNFLVSRQWMPRYDMGALSNPNAPHMDCLRCAERIYLPRAGFNFTCASCGHVHRLSDYLGIGQDAPEDWSREEAAIALRNALETLTLFYFVVRYWKNSPEALRQILFVKDGPLLLRAQLSRLVDPIRELITAIRDSGAELHMVGVEKNGELADHAADLGRALPSPGDYFIPSVRYLVEEVAGLSFDPQRYRNRVQYGCKAVVRLGADHVLPLDVPTGEFLKAPAASELIGFDDSVRTLAQMLSYSHDNALIPIKLINDYSSISQRPSGDILKAFAGELLGPS